MFLPPHVGNGALRFALIDVVLFPSPAFVRRHLTDLVGVVRQRRIRVDAVDGVEKRVFLARQKDHSPGFGRYLSSSIRFRLAYFAGAAPRPRIPRSVDGGTMPLVRM